MALSKKQNITLKAKRYAASRGAHAMDETLAKKMERSAYNYLKIDIDDPAYAQAEPYDFALQFHQFALFQAGSYAWDEMAESLVATAKQAKLINKPEQHPVWFAMLRHAKSAPNPEAAADFLSKAIFKPSIDHKSWNDLPDALKYEGFLYSVGASADMPKRLTKRRIGKFFESKAFLTAALISVAHAYYRVGNMPHFTVCMDILEALCPEYYNLDVVREPGFTYNILQLRFQRNAHEQKNQDNILLLTQGWGVFSKLTPARRSRNFRYKAMAHIFQQRLDLAKSLSLEDNVSSALNDWRDYLRKQIAVVRKDAA